MQNKEYVSMKRLKIFLYLTMIILSLQVVSSIDYCNPDVYIDAELISKIRNTEEDSDFQFHYFRETDELILNQLKVHNRNNCTIKNMVIHLFIEPQEGYTPKDKHPSNYGELVIPIPDLEEDKTVYLIREQWDRYYYKIDDETYSLPYSTWAIDLDQIGDWLITYEITDKIGKDIASSTRFTVNSKDIVWFRVLTLTETSLLKYNESSIILSEVMIRLTYALFVFTAILIIIEVININLTSKSRKEFMEQFKKINSSLDEVIKKIPQEFTKTNSSLDKILKKIPHEVKIKKNLKKKKPLKKKRKYKRKS